MRQSMSCLRGDIDVPRPLYQRDTNYGGSVAADGINMIGKARLVSASPFRASIKMDKGNNMLN